MWGFDTLGKAIITQFFVATMDEWPSWAHGVADAGSSTKWFVWPFFASIVFVQGIVVCNL